MAYLTPPQGLSPLPRGHEFYNFGLLMQVRAVGFLGVFFLPSCVLTVVYLAPPVKPQGQYGKKKLYFFYSRDPPMKPKGWFVISFTIYTPLLVMMFQKCFQKVKNVKKKKNLTYGNGYISIAICHLSDSDIFENRRGG